MNYTINTIENTTIVLTSYVRRLIDNSPMELTDSIFLISPVDGASGVSTTPEFNWSDYVKDVPIENQVYKLEVVDIATSTSTPDWTNPFIRITDKTFINLREVLVNSQFYAWRVSAKNRILPESFNDAFERVSLGSDYESSTIAGTGSSSIINDDLVIEADGTTQVSRQVTKLLKNLKNPTIYLRDVRFSNVGPDSQPTVYFNTSGNFVNNQQNGYFLFFYQDTVQIGKIIDNSPSGGPSIEFIRSINTSYDIKIKSANGYNEITIFSSGGIEPSPQLNWNDPNSPYISGGLSLVQVSLDTLGGLANTKIGSIEIIYAQGDLTEITNVIVSGSTSDIIEGQTRQFSATVEGTGSVQQSVTWVVTGGTFSVYSENAINFTAGSGAGNCSVTATSTQDETVLGTLNFNRIAEVPGTGNYENSTQGDINALQDLYSSSQGEGIPTVSNVGSLPDPETAEYPYQYIVNGELYTIYNGSSKSWVNEGVIWKNSQGWSVSNMDLNNPIYGVEVNSELRVTKIDLRFNALCGHINNSSFGNLQAMTYFNVHYNFLTGDIPPLNSLSSATHLYFNFTSASPHTQVAPHGEGPQPDEIRDDGGFDGNGNPTTGGQIHPGKNERDKTNQTAYGPNGWNDFTGMFPEVSNLQNLQYLSANWLENLEGFHDSVFHLSSAIYIGFHDIKSSKRSFPSTTNLPNLEQTSFGREGPRTKVDAWLEGDYPAIVGQWTSARYMNFSNQLLSGELFDLSNLPELRSFGVGGNQWGGPFPTWLMDGSVPLITGVTFTWPLNWQYGNTGFEGTVPEYIGGASGGLQLFRLSGNTRLTGHVYANSIGSNNFHFDIRNCNFTTIDYDISNLGRGWATRYFACPENPDLQVSGGTGIPLFPLDSKEWRTAGINMRNCSFQGTITQEAIASIVHNIENNNLRHLYLQGNKFTNAELQPLIDAVNGTGITMAAFQYGGQNPN